MWSSPPADGGSSITKYKIEWDPEETFDSGSDGGPAGSHQKVMTESSQCSSSPCEYVIASLAKGVLYAVRVFAYNQVSMCSRTWQGSFHPQLKVDDNIGLFKKFRAEFRRPRMMRCAAKSCEMRILRIKPFSRGGGFQAEPSLPCDGFGGLHCVGFRVKVQNERRCLRTLEMEEDSMRDGGVPYGCLTL